MDDPQKLVDQALGGGQSTPPMTPPPTESKPAEKEEPKKEEEKVPDELLSAAPTTAPEKMPIPPSPAAAAPAVSMEPKQPEMPKSDPAVPLAFTGTNASTKTPPVPPTPPPTMGGMPGAPKPVMPGGVKPVEPAKNPSAGSGRIRKGKRGLVAAVGGIALLLFVVLGGAIGYELITGKPGLIAVMEGGDRGSRDVRETVREARERREDRDDAGGGGGGGATTPTTPTVPDPTTNPYDDPANDYELRRLLNTGDIIQDYALTNDAGELLDIYKGDDGQLDPAIVTNIQIAQDNRTVELGETCPSSGPAGRVWECASGAGLCDTGGVCKFSRELGREGASCGGILDCANGYVCDMSASSPTLGQCIPNTSLACGRDEDLNAPICCSSTTCEGEIVCEPPGRLECKTKINDNQSVWCLLEAHSAECGWREGGGGANTVTTPTPTPSPSPSPTPKPTLACTSLTKSKADNKIKVGTNVTFTCAGSSNPAGAVDLTYTFRLRKDGGSWQTLPATGANASYTIPAVGDYEVQCKACGTIDNASVCDPSWGTAQ